MGIERPVASQVTFLFVLLCIRIEQKKGSQLAEMGLEKARQLKDQPVLSQDSWILLLARKSGLGSSAQIDPVIAWGDGGSTKCLPVI